MTIQKEIIEKRMMQMTVFITGAAILVIEILGARMLALFYGSTIFVWSSLLAITMAALAAGYFAGGKVADKYSVSMVTLYGVVAVAGIVLWSVLWYGQWVVTVTDVFGLRYGPLVSSIFLFAPSLFLLGVVSPIAIKVRANSLDTLGATAGGLYGVSTIGALVGGFLSGFYGIPLLGVDMTMYITIFILFFTATIGFIAVALSEVRNKKTTGILVVLAFLLVFVMGAGYTSFDNHTYLPTSVSENGMVQFPTLFTTQGVIEARVIYQEPSQYGDVVVYDYSRGLRCFMIDGVTSSCWNFNNNISSVYTHQIALVLKHLQIKRDYTDVLVIGVGAETLLKELDGSGLHIDGVEINPKTKEIAEQFFLRPQDLDYAVTIDDGRHFLTSTDKKYDAIIMDICFVNDANVHLWTEEFYALAKDYLKDSKQGVLIATRGTVSGNENLKQADQMSINTLQKHFDNVYTTVGYENPETFYMEIFMASESEVDIEKFTELKLRLIRRASNDEYITVKDSQQGEFLKLTLPATEAILEQSKANFGERLLLPI